MSDEKAIRIIAFSGKKNDWRQWSRKFMAVANKRGYKEYVEGNKRISSSSSEEERGKNTAAYNDMLLAMTDDVSFGLVDESTTSECPDGDAFLAWSKLQQKFESKTSASRVKLMNQFTNNKLKKLSKDPDEWISELELTRTRLKKMGTDIDESYMMMHILNNVPGAYDNLVDALEDRLDSSTDPLTIENLREKLSEKYEKMKARKKFRHDDSDSDEEEEKALFAGGKFKGRCNYCGKFGHKAIQCNKKKNDEKNKSQGNNGNRRFNGKCNFCGKFGHKEVHCWEKHGKPNKNNEDGREDSANQAVDRDQEDDSEEEGNALMCYEIHDEESNEDLACVVLEPDSGSFFDQQNTMAFKSTQSEVGIGKNVWIGDTGASSHMTHSKEGMRNMRPIKSWIIFGNGQRLQSTHVGDKHGTALQKDGMRTSITIKDVKYVPELFCNLFSIPMALRNGCTLEGSKDRLIIKKDNKKYFFDKRIKSGNGILFGIEIIEKKEEHKHHEKSKIVDIMRYHEMLGHASEAMTRSTAARMNVRLKGQYTYCDGCSQGKMRQKNIPKVKVKQADSPGVRFFLDISSIKYESLGGARYWVLMMDDCTGFLSSFFLKKNQT